MLSEVTSDRIILAIPFGVGIILALITPLLSGMAQRALSGQIAEQELLFQTKGGGTTWNTPPYLKRRVVVEDYVTYTADVAQIFPAMLLPIVGAIFAFKAGGSLVPSIILLLTILISVAFQAWALGVSAVNYSSRRIRGGYSLVNVAALVTNTVCGGLVVLFG